MMRLLLHKTRQSGCKELINHHKLDGDSALHLAARKGSLEIVKVLTEFGAKGAAFNKNHETPVYVAAKNNHWEVVEYLVERNKGAIDQPDMDGWTPLLIAADFGHIESADVLLKAGADICKADRNDQNLIFIAAKEGRHRFLKHIFQHENCKPEFDLANARDIYHNAPLHVAAEKGHLECVKTLFENKGSGCNINALNLLDKKIL